jgi:hypothetical protein
MCDNMVVVYRRGTPLEFKCGAFVGSRVVLCEACEKAAREMYPQGWRNVPGDICRHGNYVGTCGGPDHICHKCEEGEE